MSDFIIQHKEKAAVLVCLPLGLFSYKIEVSLHHVIIIQIICCVNRYKVKLSQFEKSAVLGCSLQKVSLSHVYPLKNQLFCHAFQ